jgi:putative membrane protein
MSGPTYDRRDPLRNFLIRLFVNSLALSAAAWLVDGITLSGGFAQVLIVALVFGILNALLKPFLVIFSLPFIVVTLGLFALVVNGVMLLVTARVTDHLAVSGLGAAVLGSIVISFVTILLGGVLEDGEKG